MSLATFDAISHRIVLAQWIKAHHWTRVAEIGVKKGTTYLYLLEQCPDLHLLGVDIWENVVEKLPEHEQRLRQIVAERYAERATLVKATSVEAAEKIPDGSLDCVFIDADHSEAAVRADIVAWWRKVRPGGMLAGHDVNQPQVRRAVDALCPGWASYAQAIWGMRVTEPKVVAMTPYADDRNLGRAYNEAMALLPENGWACLLDHDAMFTTKEWHRQITAAVLKRPDACFAGRTNRIKCPWQLVPDVDIKNHDIAYHRAIGARLLGNDTLRDVTVDPEGKHRTPSGLIMILPKLAWQQAGGFPEGMHYVDRLMWLALRMVGRPTVIIEGLYLYHWHRAQGEPLQRGAWATRHTLRDGRVIALKPTVPLPEYTG